MKKLTALIVEDEKNGQQPISTLLDKYCPDVNIIGYATSIDTALKIIKKEKPLIIFLEIKLGNESGFDLVGKIKSLNLNIIFTTSVASYAIDAFKANAIDYLLKPIQPSRLVDAINKIINLINMQISQSQITNLIETIKKEKIKKICIPSKNNGISIVDLKNVVYVEGSGSYSTFFLKSKEKLIASKNLGHFQSLLSESIFYRTHQSYLVNVNYVSKINPNEGTVTLQHDHQISIAKNRCNGLMSLLT